jgi:Carboxypeptidase regulatory-like domain
MAQPIARRLSMILWVTGALLLLPLGLQAQATGTISGYVKDPSGAVIPGAQVAAVQIERGISTNTVTNAQGFYNFPALEPGTYTITVEKPGFERHIQGGITLTVNQNLRVDAALQLGAVTGSITVTGAVPLVDTTSATISGLVDDRRVVDLPLNGRNIIGLSEIVPGVLSVSAPEDLACARAGPTMDVNGGRADMNLFTFDGAYFINPSRNTGMNYPPPDAIQEFRIQTASFDAEYGHNSGSQVTVVSKAGSDQFHGSLWEFLRNDALNARNFFTPTVPALKQNQFGGAAGGPIEKNKLFFFGSYQELLDRPQAVPVEAFVPSAAERSGDFTSLLPKEVLTDPVNSLTGQPLTDPTGRTCVANNIINPNCISPVAKNMLSFVPQSASGAVVTLAPSPVNDSTFFGRIDANLSAKNTLFGHVFVDHTTNPQPFASCGNIAGYDGQNFVEETDMVMLNDTWTFSPTLVNQAVVSYLRDTSDEINTHTLTTSTLGIDMPQFLLPGSVSVGVAGLFNLGSGYDTRFIGNNYQVRDALTWMKGRHSFNFGVEYLRPNFVQTYIGSPSFNFNGAASGNPMSDFLLGQFNALSLQFGVADDDDINQAPSLFFQDTFKVAPRYTLTYGVRYDPELFWYDAHNKLDMIKVGAQSTVIPSAPPGILFPGDPGVPRTLVPADWKNVAPRLGFAWDVFGNGKTAVRAAYGVFFEAINADTMAQENAPFVGDGVAYNGNMANPFGSVGLANPPVAPTGQFGCVKISAAPGLNCPLFPLPATGFFGGSSLQSPYVQEANVTLQQQITANTMLQAGYVGKWGIHLPGRVYFNPAAFVPGTTYASATGTETTISTPANADSRAIYEPGILSPTDTIIGTPYRSWYNSFYTQVTKRMSHGLSVTASYTLAKSLDTLTTITELGAVSDPFDIDANRGRSNFDVRNAFVASYLWSPAIKFRSRWETALLGRWTFSGITSLQSGPPITFLQGADVALDGTTGYDQENAFLNGQPIGLSHGSTGAMVDEFFNTNAFVYPLCGFTAQPGNAHVIQQENCTPFGYKYSMLGKFGNSGRGILGGPAYYDTDFAVLKDFLLSEQKRLEFRLELFDLFNSPNFGLPVSTVTDSSFGRITSANSSRVIQLALKLYW